MFDEFSRRFTDRVREANWEGWTPPWMSQEGQGSEGPGRGFGGPRHGWHGPRGPFFGPGRRWGQGGIPEELLALRVQAAEVARLFMIASRGAFGNKERLTQLRAFLDRSHKELAEIIYGPASDQAQATEEQASNASESEEA